MKGFFSKKLALGLALVVLVGVALAWAAQTQTQPEQMQSEMKDAPKTDPERVLAKVSDREIREKDIDQVIRMMGPQGAMMYDNPQGRRAVLDELVSMHLFALRGAEEKLDQTPEFKAALETFRNQSLARAAIDASLKDVTASDEDAKKFYDEHPDQFT